MIRNLTIALAACTLAFVAICGQHLPHPPASYAALAPATDTIYFSPTQNFETVDIALIRQAKTSIDIAMYSFTDTSIARALSDAALRGVHIRIYRDLLQYEGETKRKSPAAAILFASKGIEVRVKESTVLMHEKAMLIDGKTLRDGSGNWSPSALRQDNEITVTNDAAQCQAFAQDFEVMWNRPTNVRVQ